MCLTHPAAAARAVGAGGPFLNALLLIGPAPSPTAAPLPPPSVVKQRIDGFLTQSIFLALMCYLIIQNYYSVQAAVAQWTRRLPTEQEIHGSSPCSGMLFCLGTILLSQFLFLAQQAPSAHSETARLVYVLTPLGTRPFAVAFRRRMRPA